MLRVRDTEGVFWAGACNGTERIPDPPRKVLADQRLVVGEAKNLSPIPLNDMQTQPTPRDPVAFVGGRPESVPR